MDDLPLNYRFLNWRRRIRDREVRAGRFQERSKHILVDGDNAQVYHGSSGEVGCYVAPRPLTRDNNYFEVRGGPNGCGWGGGGVLLSFVGSRCLCARPPRCPIVDSGCEGTIAVGLVPQFYSLDHQPGWLPGSVAYHGDDGKLYSGRAKGRQFGSKCSSGDRGCGIERVSLEVRTAHVFFTPQRQEGGSTEVPLCSEGLFPAVGMHSLGEEVRLHLRAALRPEPDDCMVVDSVEEEWGRLHDVRACGTVLEYVGQGKSIVDVGLAQARRPLSTRSHYFELEIVDPGEKCYIALGLARKVAP
ncbi:LOW QUALITY PROTEIN: SPRY domain-containing protein 3 [Amazona ochrocephala]